MKKWHVAVALVAPMPGGDGGYGGNSGKGGNSKGKSKGKAGAPRGSYKWIWQLVQKLREHQGSERLLEVGFLLRSLNRKLT